MRDISLLLDENLSESVLTHIEPHFPRSSHIRRSIGPGATDRAVWEHARNNGLVLVSRDEDFQRLSVLHGAPPKVIWLRGHNLSNVEVVEILRSARDRIRAFVADPELALLVLGS